MPIEVILPKVDMDMATGKIAKWHVKDGDAVRKGASLFEIETDKAAMEIDAPGDGIIRNITAAEGAVIPVGQTVALIYQDGEFRCGTCRFGILTPGEAHYTGTSSRCGTNSCSPCSLRIWTFSCNPACPAVGETGRNCP